MYKLPAHSSNSSMMDLAAALRTGLITFSNVRAVNEARLSNVGNISGIVNSSGSSK